MINALPRMLNLDHATSPQPLDDLIVDSRPNFWFRSNETQYSQQFSAICALFAQYLNVHLGNRVIF